MVARNLSIPHRFVCLTEDPTGLDDQIECKPLPPGLRGYWNKLSLFKPDMFESGEQVIYLDLDVVIVGSIDFLVPDDTSFHTIRNWPGKGPTFNSSVMCFPAGKYEFIYDRFIGRAAEIVSSPAYPGDQDWIAEQVPEAKGFPAGKVLSFKIDLKSHVWSRAKKLKLTFDWLRAPAWMTVSPPPEAAIIVFHGKPDPEDVADGPYGPWKHAPFVNECWR